jgi:anti-sigma factor RsiW
MSCPEFLRVQAYLDGESADAQEIEKHLETCRDCAQLRKDILELRSAIRSAASYHRADARLARRIARVLDRGLDRASVPRWMSPGFWAGAASGAFATGCAAALSVFLLLPPQSDRLADDVLNAHLRSLVGQHLIDVASSNRHTVKPWFAGRTDVSPVVEDHAAQGYPLIGGREDYVDGLRAAVIVYRHGLHVINIFAWRAGDQKLPTQLSRNGYEMIFWKSGGIAYCAVSDMGLNELSTLVRLIGK